MHYNVLWYGCCIMHALVLCGRTCCSMLLMLGHDMTWYDMACENMQWYVKMCYNLRWHAMICHGPRPIKHNETAEHNSLSATRRLSSLVALSSMPLRHSSFQAAQFLLCNDMRCYAMLCDVMQWCAMMWCDATPPLSCYAVDIATWNDMQMIALIESFCLTGRQNHMGISSRSYGIFAQIIWPLCWNQICSQPLRWNQISS